MIRRRPRHLPAAHRHRRGDHHVLPRRRRAQLGPRRSSLLTSSPSGCSILPLSMKQIRSMRALQRVAPELKADPGEVQGRPPAPAAGDDELLPGERDQPARLLLPVAAPDPGLHRPLLPAARRHLPAGRRVERRRGQLPLHPGHPDPARGRREVGADRPLHRHHDAHVLYTTATTQTTTGPAEVHLLGAAVPVRPVRSPASRPASSVYWITTNLWTPRPAGGRADDHADADSADAGGAKARQNHLPRRRARRRSGE